MKRWPIWSWLWVLVGGIYFLAPLAGTLGFVAPPPLYWPLLVATLLCYIVLTQFVKTWFVKKFGGD